MITIPIVCRPAINLIGSAPLDRLFAKAAAMVLRDLAVTLDARGPADEITHGQGENGPKVLMTFENFSLSAERAVVSRTLGGTHTDTRIVVTVDAASQPVMFTTVQLAGAHQQLHAINRLRSALSLPQWSMSQLVSRDLAGLRRVA
ncbi:MAG: hypothetical protein ABI583_00180 [Betaproteobacteria bacterium]